MSRPRIQIYWQNPPTGAVAVERLTRGGRVETRDVSPQGLLDLDEAASVLRRSRAEVLRAIRAGFLHASRRGGRFYVTPRACMGFLREEHEDRRVAQVRKREPTIPAVVVTRRGR